MWAKFETLTAEEFLGEIQDVVTKLAPDAAVGFYELASAHDSTGNEKAAAVYYKNAFDHGLDETTIRAATIQYASTLRNLGRADQAIELLSSEKIRTNDELDDAVAAFLSLCLHDAGRSTEALTTALLALEPHLPKYNRSLKNYAIKLSAKKSKT